MSTPQWISTRILDTSRIRNLVQGINNVSDQLRFVIQSLEGVADLVGIAGAATRAFCTSSPAVGLLNSGAALLQELTNDLLEQGAYVLVHHNIDELLGDIGLVNSFTSTSTATRNLPSVASPYVSTPGTNPEAVRDEQVTGQGSLLYNEGVLAAAGGSDRASTRGYVGWIDAILRAFEDIFDPRRPRIADNGNIGGFIFLTGAGTLPELRELLEAFAAVFEFSDFVQWYNGLDGIESRDLTNLARLGDAGLIRNVIDSAFDGRGEAPDFLSFKLADLIPGVGRIVINVQALVELLSAFDTIGNWGSELAHAIEQRIRQMSKAFESIAALVDKLALLVDLPQFSVLALPVEAGGIDNLANRVRFAEDRPPFGLDDFIVGGGIFVTRPVAYDLIRSLLFPDDTTGGGGPAEDIPLLQFYPASGVGGMSVSDYVIAPSSWATWAGDKWDLERVASGAQLRQSSLHARPRGLDASATSDESYTDAGGMTGGAPGSLFESGGGLSDGSVSGGSAGHTSTRSSDTPGELDRESLGSAIGGMTIQRSSWATYLKEITDLALGTGERGPVVSEEGTNTYCIAHNANDIARMEAIPDLSPVGVLTTGVLLEGVRTNLYPDSDRFDNSTVHYRLVSNSLPILENGAPSTDLSRYRIEAGPIGLLGDSVTDCTVYYDGLRGSVDFSGCKITNVVDDTGHVFVVSPTHIGTFLIGYQSIQILDRIHTSFFITEIVGIDVVRNGYELGTAVFTEPIASGIHIGPFAITVGPPFPWLEQHFLALGPGINTFSVFARGAYIDPNNRVVSLQFIGDALGPAYSNQVDLSLPVVRELLPDGASYIEDATLIAQNVPGGDVRAGHLIELRETANTLVPQLYAKKVTVGTTIDVLLETSAGNPIEYAAQTVDSAWALEVENTYQGFVRASLEVPKQHTVRTQLVPSILQPSILTLSHSVVSSAQVFLIDGTVLIPISENAGLVGVSWRLAPGAGLAGRAAIEVSDDLKTLYFGRILQVVYDVAYASGTARIYPMSIHSGTGMIPVIPPPGGGFSPFPILGDMIPGWVYLCRAQWEQGPLSSSIPTAKNRTRTRAADKMFVADGTFKLPTTLDREFELTVTYSPTNRSYTLFEGEQWILLYATEYLVVSLAGSALGTVLQLSVGDIPTLYTTGVFTFEADDILVLRIGFAYGGTSIRWEVTVNGVPVIDTTATVLAIPAIDDLVSSGARIYVGSNSSGGDSCFGRILDLELKDKVIW